MADDLENMSNFDEYLRQDEPQLRERAESWKTAIGLQQVDGLKPSGYLLDTARRHIEGDITIDEVKKLIDTYYQTQTAQTEHGSETEEADKASINIAKLLNEKTFSFSVAGYLAIHRRIFDGILKHAGKVRDYNITKQEWVLNGDTVLYAGADEIKKALEHDLSKEAEFDYKNLAIGDMVAHFAKFISSLWQIHAFGEGNTRTTAVFAIKYLRAMGFEANNDLFADNSWYFRNALVRANYRNYRKNITPNTEYLERFFRNLLMDEQNKLKNRYLHIDAAQTPQAIPPQATPPQATPQATPQVGLCDDAYIIKLVKVLGDKKMSVKELLTALNLRDRKNLMESYITPAIKEGFACLLYPDTPRHPEQKYLLTDKGMALYREI